MYRIKQCSNIPPKKLCILSDLVELPRNYIKVLVMLQLVQVTVTGSMFLLGCLSLLCACLISPLCSCFLTRLCLVARAFVFPVCLHVCPLFVFFCAFFSLLAHLFFFCLFVCVLFLRVCLFGYLRFYCLLSCLLGSLLVVLFVYLFFVNIPSNFFLSICLACLGIVLFIASDLLLCYFPCLLSVFLHASQSLVFLLACLQFCLFTVSLLASMLVCHSFVYFQLASILLCLPFTCLPFLSSLSLLCLLVCLLLSTPAWSSLQGLRRPLTQDFAAAAARICVCLACFFFSLPLSSLCLATCLIFPWLTCLLARRVLIDFLDACDSL